MKCPHCLNHIHPQRTRVQLNNHKSNHNQVAVNPTAWYAEVNKCPSCDKDFFYLYGPAVDKILVWPKAFSRSPIPPEVPAEYISEYGEACLTLADSPKASAALSRRCLQRILTDAAGISKTNLDEQIRTVINTGRLPSYITESLDAVRTIGNFAAHPIKSVSSGEIIEVEPGEAEWNLDVLESLFDFYFVQPAIIKKKRADLDAKLAEAGKKPLK